jgi:hypoxanthine phosphoribosyltransferase
VITAVLVEKAAERSAVQARADIVGLKADNRYLFGYGMDYKHYLRNAPGIYAVKDT